MRLVQAGDNPPAADAHRRHRRAAGPADLFRPTIGLAIGAGQPTPPLCAYYRAGLRVEVEPGSKWAYANHGFAVLGQLVEDVSGEPFGAYMRAHVFGPLGMEHTDFARTGPITRQLATGYTLRRRGLKAVKDRDIVVQPAGRLLPRPPTWPATPRPSCAGAATC